MLGSVQHRNWGRRSNGDTQQEQGGKRESCQGCDLEPESVARAEVADDSEGEEKYSSGNRSQRYQRYVNDAVNLLAAGAALAILEMAFVVAAHFGRQA